MAQLTIFGGRTHHFFVAEMTSGGNDCLPVWGHKL